MNQNGSSPVVKSTSEVGLLASGTSSRWHIAIDESIDSEERFLEIDTPVIYLNCRLEDTSTPEKILRFLLSTLQPPQKRDEPLMRSEGDSLMIGRFGSLRVSLLRDNEDFPRCFLVVGPKSQFTFRYSLYREEIEQFATALSQVVDDLQPSAEKN